MRFDSFGATSMSILDPSSQVRNGAFIEAAMAASALVSTADGEVSFDQRHKVDEILENLTAFTAFNYHAALVQFEAFAEEIRRQPSEGAAKALKVVAAQADSAEDSRIILRIACAVARSEGRNPRASFERIEEVARALGQTPPVLEDGKPASTIPQASRRAICIAIGNQKGGTGKSTTAVHLAVGLMARGHRVGCIDLDGEQGTFSHYLENRRAYVEKAEPNVPVPVCRRVEPSPAEHKETAQSEDRSRLNETFESFAGFDYVIVDTPGNKGRLSRLGHINADVLITPLNDSFLDIDVLADIDLDERQVLAPSAYAEMVMTQNRQRTDMGRRPIDWLVMRNRLAQLDTRNSRDMRRLLDRLSERMGFELLPGLSERMIFRELFYKGLTLLDLPELPDEARNHASRWNARQEIDRLVDAVTARCPAGRTSDAALLTADLDFGDTAPGDATAGDMAAGEEEPDASQEESEDPFLMLKEAMSQSH
jgi:chromosome partitioning protein